MTSLYLHSPRSLLFESLCISFFSQVGPALIKKKKNMNKRWLHIKVNCWRIKTYLNFNRKVVGPFNINDIFQNELILCKKRKKHYVKSVLFFSSQGNKNRLLSMETIWHSLHCKCQGLDLLYYIAEYQEYWWLKYWSELEIITEGCQYLLWFLTEEEALVKFGLTEAAADDSDGTVVCSTMIVSPEFKELSLTRHVFSECFKTWPIMKITQLILVGDIRTDFTSL